MSSEHTYKVGDKVKITMQGAMSNDADSIYYEQIGKIGIIKELRDRTPDILSAYTNTGQLTQILVVCFPDFQHSIAFYTDEVVPVGRQLLFSFMDAYDES